MPSHCSFDDDLRNRVLSRNCGERSQKVFLSQESVHDFLYGEIASCCRLGHCSPVWRRVASLRFHTVPLGRPRYPGCCQPHWSKIVERSKTNAAMLGLSKCSVSSVVVRVAHREIEEITQNILSDIEKRFYRVFSQGLQIVLVRVEMVECGDVYG